MRFPLFLAAVLLAALPAQASERVVVVELFSSQACPSCPAADAVVSGLAQADATLLPLDLHVTYFDRAGWKDAYSLPAASQRHRRYASQLGTAGVYTPQVVVSGRHEALGYDVQAVRAAVAQAHGAMDRTVPLDLVRDAAGLRLTAGAGQGHGTLWLVGFDPAGSRRGGVNLVRALQSVGEWHGAPVTFAAVPPRGSRTALLLQDDRGAILAAAVLN